MCLTVTEGSSNRLRKMLRSRQEVFPVYKAFYNGSGLPINPHRRVFVSPVMCARYDTRVPEKRSKGMIGWRFFMANVTVHGGALHFYTSYPRAYRHRYVFQMWVRKDDIIAIGRVSSCRRESIAARRAFWMKDVALRAKPLRSLRDV